MKATLLFALLPYHAAAQSTYVLSVSDPSPRCSSSLPLAPDTFVASNFTTGPAPSSLFAISMWFTVGSNLSNVRLWLFNDTMGMPGSNITLAQPLSPVPAEGAWQVNATLAPAQVPPSNAALWVVASNINGGAASFCGVPFAVPPTTTQTRGFGYSLSPHLISADLAAWAPSVPGTLMLDFGLVAVDPPASPTPTAPPTPPPSATPSATHTPSGTASPGAPPSSTPTFSPTPTHSDSPSHSPAPAPSPREPPAGGAAAAPSPLGPGAVAAIAIFVLVLAAGVAVCCSTTALAAAARAFLCLRKAVKDPLGRERAAKAEFYRQRTLRGDTTVEVNPMRGAARV